MKSTRAVPTLQRQVDETYLGLRLAMVLLVGLLFGSVLWEYFSGGGTCVQNSLSAYYYTPVRPMFIAALCSVGACLIIYRGNTDLENVLLDFSGFLAFVVAFVPTGFDGDACDLSNEPSDAEIASAVNNNLPVLLLAGIAAVGLGFALLRWWHSDYYQELSVPAKWSAGVSLAALLAGVVFFGVRPDVFYKNGHLAAATVLFVGIFLVTVANAYGAGRKRVSRVRYEVWYTGVAVYMAAAFGVLLVAKLLTGFRHFGFYLETALTSGFLVFWIVQTVELGGYVSRYTAGESGQAPASTVPSSTSPEDS